MQEIEVTVTGMALDLALVRKMVEPLALAGDEMASLISWNDRDRGIHSPQCLKCEIKGEPGWEVYGRNHGGRVRISVNDDSFVLIYS